MSSEGIKRDTSSERQNIENGKTKMKKEKIFQTKVVIRRLPPTMTEEQFREQIAPIPENDYLQFVKGDMSLGQHAFSRGYINFTNPDDIFVFKEKFDGYVFIDNKGNEYPAVVEFAPFQKIPKKKTKKRDAKCGTIEQDPDYIKFLESIQNPEHVVLPTTETYLEIIEARERELKANNGVMKVTTPLIEYLKQRKIEQQKIREEKREERKRREMEKRRLREEERRRRKAEKDKEKDKVREKKEGSVEKELFKERDKSPKSDDPQQSETVVVKVLRNPEREKDRDKDVTHGIQKPKESTSLLLKSPRDRDRGRKEWERQRDRERERQRVRERERPRPTNIRDKLRKDREDYRSCISDTIQKTNVAAEEKRSSLNQTEASAERVKYSSGEKTEQRSSFEGSRYKTTENLDIKKSNYVNAKESELKDSEGVGGFQDDVTGNRHSFTDSRRSSEESSRDPRLERRIRNKDRPSLEIYRPGMRRLGTQKSAPQKEVSTSASNSSTPSPSPTPTNQGCTPVKKTSGEWSKNQSQQAEAKSTNVQESSNRKDKGKEATKPSLTESDKADETVC